MKTTVASRIVAALMSVTVTLLVLNALALYGHPQPASVEAQIAANTTTVVASASK
jgi:hypothetical protein